MRLNKCLFIIGLASMLAMTCPPALAQEMDNFGQVLKISTNLRSFVGRPSWLIIIRDVDHGQNIPYLFDFESGDNYWLAFTFSRDYLITVSELVLNPSDRKITNFCNLESMGSVLRGESMDIILSGRLSPNSNTYSCHVLKYTDPDFNIGSTD